MQKDSMTEKCRFKRLMRRKKQGCKNSQWPKRIELDAKRGECAKNILMENDSSKGADFSLLFTFLIAAILIAEQSYYWNLLFFFDKMSVATICGYTPFFSAVAK